MRSKFSLTIVPSVSVGITLAVLLAFSAVGATAHATTYYWDPAGNGSGGSGTWDASTTQSWSPNTGGSSDNYWLASGATQAEFYSSTGTVTLNGTVSLQNLLFDSGTGYTINNGTSGLLNFNNAASTIGVNATATINAPFNTTTSSTLLSITGASTLTFGSAATGTFATSSSVNVTGGATVVIQNNAVFGTGATRWSLGSGTLDLQCGSLPAGQFLFNTPTSTSDGTVYTQSGNFSIVSDAANPSSPGVTYSGTTETIPIGGSTGGTSTSGTRTFSLVGGANVSSGTAGLYLPSLTIAGYTPAGNSTGYTWLNLNLVNPTHGGLTLLKVDNLGRQHCI